MTYLVDAHRCPIEQAACLSYFQHIEICHRGVAGAPAESRRKWLWQGAATLVFCVSLYGMLRVIRAQAYTSAARYDGEIPA